MKVFSKQADLSAALARAEGTVGFVPTMGALHEGHASLVRRCRAENDQVVVSVFVNPTQFNDPADLKNYPRTLEADLALLEAAGADWVYAPAVEDIYPEPDTRQFDFGPLDKVMEGACRPGHFNGVGQVVSRLLGIVKPDVAYFGEKDFQQLAIIRQMVRQLNIPVRIEGCPIVREADGLALSSRNRLLTPEHRAAAPLIHQALEAGAAQAGKRPVAEVRKLIEATIASDPLLDVEYVSIVDNDTLQEIAQWTAAPLRVCVAVRAGAIRLIDNMDMSVKPE